MPKSVYKIQDIHPEVSVETFNSHLDVMYEFVHGGNRNVANRKESLEILACELTKKIFSNSKLFLVYLLNICFFVLL